MRSIRNLLLPVLAGLVLGCSVAVDTPQNQGPGGTPIPPTELPPEQQAELDSIMAEMQSSANMTADDFATKYSVPFQSLSYDPSAAMNLPLIQASQHALDADELAVLGKNGFVISERMHFPTFVYGYESLYAQDLPLYVSADSILYAVHRSYDEILKQIELGSLIPDLSKFLAGMRDELAAGGAGALGAQARADTDLFLAVALSLLDGQAAAPVAGANASTIASLVAKAEAHSGWEQVELFGVARDEDFSQFEPRGHYKDAPELERYFRSMMWLGRIDFRLIETQPDGSQVFQRRQFEGMLALGDLARPENKDRWTRIDKVIGAFVGEPDYMMLPQVSSLLGDLGVQNAADTKNIPDSTIAQAIVDGGYGTQRISSHIMINGLGDATLPLSSSFALFGQRYVLDSHVFSNVVYDRVQGGKVYRMMPNPLDAAFAALKNDQAGQLLLPELQQYSYAPDLHMMRVLADSHPSEFWTANLYNLWLSSLQTLSPSDEIQNWATVGLPEIAATEPWGRRLINTQLASWAELRHDTILYAKQSYTGGSSCEFPDAYVDPYPQFYEKVADFATYGKDLVATLDLSAAPWLQQSIPDYFTRLYDVSKRLQSMAEHERTGTPFDVDQMAFINQAVKVQLGCGDPTGAEGWYPELFFDVFSSVEYDPTIADVHTQPTDEVGNPVGKVLHVGTGMPRIMVVTMNTCTGPRAYVGLASSYFERTTENFDRLDDQQWAQDIQSVTPDDVSWMTDIVVR